MRLFNLFAAILILSIVPAGIAAQEIPRDLGRNAGTGDPVLRVGSWELDGIKTTAFSAYVSPQRDTKELPVDTRERGGISFVTNDYVIKATVVFLDLKETVTGTNAAGANPGLRVLVKTEVMTTKDIGGKNDYLPMRCNIDFTLASGDKGGGTWRDFKIYPAYYPDYKKDEFICGGDLKTPFLRGADFTLNLELMFYTSKPVDVTYHFLYRWQGWDAQPQASGTPESSTLDLIDKALRKLVNSIDKFTGAYADIAMLSENWASKAPSSGGQKMKVGSDRASHKTWAGKQPRDVVLKNLQQKVSATFKLLDRSQQAAFSREVSALLAGSEATATGPGGQENGLTGLWKNPGSEAVYRVRQVGSKVVWGLDATARGSHANMFEGEISGNNIDGVWEDLPGSPTIGGGRMLLRIESDCRFVRVSSVNPYGADVWVREGSTCDQPSSDTSALAAEPAGPLTGLWRNPGGEAVYRFRHLGNKLLWGVDAVPIRSFANAFEGDVSGSTIQGSWLDLPGSPVIGGGDLSLRVESDCRIVKTREVNRYAADVWVRIGSPCDVTSLAQKTTTAAAKPAPQNEKPPGAVVVVSDPSGIFDKPTVAKSQPKVEPSPVASVPSSSPAQKPRLEDMPDDRAARRTGTTQAPRLEEIPDNRTATTQKPRLEEIPDSRTATTQKPRLEEIPDDRTSTTQKPRLEDIPDNRIPPPDPDNRPAEQPRQRPTPTPKPGSGGGSKIDWGSLGRAVGDAIRAGGQTGQTGGNTGGGPVQPDGSCRGGSYWIGTPPPTRHMAGFQIPWSSPFGADRHHFRVYHAGTDQRVTDNDQPQNEKACGLSWHFYLPAGQYDVYLFPGTFANTWNTNTRPVAGPVRVIITQ